MNDQCERTAKGQMLPEVVIADATAPPPEIPPEAAQAWAIAEQSCKSEPLLLAMRYRLAGFSFRQIAELVENAPHRRNVQEGLRRWRLMEVSRQASSDQLVDNHREIALRATEKQLENLDSGEVDVKLSVVSGISTDKVASAERWNQRAPRGENLGDRLVEIAEKIVRVGGKLDLTIEGPGGKAEIEAGE